MPPENSREGPQSRSRDHQKKASVPVSHSDTQLLSSKTTPPWKQTGQEQRDPTQTCGLLHLALGNNELQEIGIFHETSWWEKEQTEAWSRLEEDLVFLREAAQFVILLCSGKELSQHWRVEPYLGQNWLCIALYLNINHMLGGPWRQTWWFLELFLLTNMSHLISLSHCTVLIVTLIRLLRLSSQAQLVRRW